MGGYADREQIEAHLGRLRLLWMQYAQLDRDTGGAWRLAENIAQLEHALSGESMRLPDAEHAFLKKNNQVKWHTGVPTWEHWELVDGEWQITTYSIEVALTPIDVRSDIAGNL